MIVISIVRIIIGGMSMTWMLLMMRMMIVISDSRRWTRSSVVLFVHTEERLMHCKTSTRRLHLLQP